MRKWKYFKWADPYKGWGEGPALIYIEARRKEEAKEKLRKQFGFKNDPHFIDGDVREVKEFVQPKQIKVVK